MYLIYVAKLQKNIEKTKRFPDYFLTKVPPDTKPWDPCLKILLCVFASLRIKGTGRVIRSSSDHGPVPLIPFKDTGFPSVSLSLCGLIKNNLFASLRLCVLLLNINQLFGSENGFLCSIFSNFS